MQPDVADAATSLHAAVFRRPRGRRRFWATLRGPGGIETLEEEGTGPIDALVDALTRRSGRRLEVVAFHEHALTRGTDAEAAAYVCLRAGDREAWGAGRACRRPSPP
jgi:2-isopropylmalate synthase